MHVRLSVCEREQGMRVRTIRDATAATASCRYAVSFLQYPAGTEGRSVRSGKEGEVGEGTGRRSGRCGMGGIQNDPPSDGASAMAWGDCCLHALLNPDLAGEAGATVVSPAPEVAAAWWEK